MGLSADFLKVADLVVGRTLCALLPRTAEPSPGETRPPSRILVIRPGGIGDAVLFLPMLQALHAAWPGVAIDLLAERRNANVVAPTGLVADLFLYDRFPGDLWRVVRRGYDLVIDTEQYHCLSAVMARLCRAPRRIGFGTNVRRRMLTTALPYSQETYEARSFLALAESATGQPAPFDPEAVFYPLAESDRQFARTALEPIAELMRVAIHPGASIPQRRWPPERYAQLARMLAERGVGVVVLGGATDREAAQQITRQLVGFPHVSLAGSSSLAQAAAAVAECDVYVSADTGVLHLAYAVGTPSVHLFGPGVLAKWGPPGSRFRSLGVAVPCSPCTTYGYTPPCCQGLVCMLKITAEDVLKAVSEQLEAVTASRRAASVGRRA